MKIFITVNNPTKNHNQLFQFNNVINVMDVQELYPATSLFTNSWSFTPSKRLYPPGHVFFEVYYHTLLSYKFDISHASQSSLSRLSIL